jgi:hypothetical protein
MSTTNDNKQRSIDTTTTTDSDDDDTSTTNDDDVSTTNDVNEGRRGDGNEGRRLRLSLVSAGRRDDDVATTTNTNAASWVRWRDLVDAGPKRRDTSFGLRYVFLFFFSYLFTLLKYLIA